MVEAEEDGKGADMDRNWGLRDDQLTEIGAILSQRIREGLGREGAEIGCLPTYVPLGGERPDGEALVVDLGGTNVRAARVALDSKLATAFSVLSGPVKASLPVRRGRALTLEEFLKVQVDLVRQLDMPAGLPLGYCFSYPAESLLNGDARLIRWTKEVDVLDTRSALVGTLLREALGRAGVHCGPVTVVNDTVASLLAGVGGEPKTVPVGLIVGTGTNMAVGLPVHAISKLPAEARSLSTIPVNLESGNFHPPHLTQWDDQLDAQTDNQGRQRFEKAVSGAYLGHLLALANPKVDFDPAQGAQGLVQLCQDAYVAAEVRREAQAILDRSADLVAASLAGLVAGVGSGTMSAGARSPKDARCRRVRIVAEGGLFWGAPGYAHRVRGTLARLLTLQGAGDLSMEILAVPDANLRGTALAALSRG